MNTNGIETGLTIVKTAKFWAIGSLVIFAVGGVPALVDLIAGSAALKFDVAYVFLLALGSYRRKNASGHGWLPCVLLSRCLPSALSAGSGAR